MQLKHVLATALAAAAVEAQSNSTNLTGLISSNSDLSGLATLLNSYPQIASSLANATNVTLFAPNNQALQAVQSTLSAAGGNTNTLIQSLLSYHVLQGTFYAANITSTPQFPHTLLNNTNFTTVTGGQVVECRLEGETAEIISGLKNVANVTQANLNFTGGVVHVIDNVLTIPESFANTAELANLTALLGAVQATNLSSAIGNLSDVTIFAPSNSAFQSIGSAVGNLTTEQARSILEYHVINGTIAYSSSLANASIPTLGGGNVTISIVNGSVFVNSARVVNADLLISNGVMHVIDSVLNPNDTATRNSSETGAATAYSGATSASEVPYTSGIPTPTTTVTELITTVSDVASGYSTQVAAGGEATSSRIGSSSSKGVAAMPTGAVGAAALFGGAALLANF